MDANSRLAIWMQELGDRVPAFGSLLYRAIPEQIERGYFHTLREICQQPLTWDATADLAASRVAGLKECVWGGRGEEAIRGLVLTGSGSSYYAADCLAVHLQHGLGIPATSIPSGQLLTHRARVFPPLRPSLLISLARSGDSPESGAVMRAMLASEPNCRHLVITCNEDGSLARDFGGERRLRVLTLAPQTNDRSLVMTSSFTNMIVAGWALGSLDQIERYQRIVRTVSAIGSNVLLRDASALASVASRRFPSAVYLASGDRLGAAHECALKMLESTAGRVHTLADTYLGLRHGPMSAVHDSTLVVCYLSSDPCVLPYELDLIAELNRKQVGGARIVLGASVPRELVRDQDVVIECAGLESPGDGYSAIIDVLAGQLLAFFRSMQEGLHPDSPSNGGIINRVVEKFPIYSGEAGDCI